MLALTGSGGYESTWLPDAVRGAQERQLSKFQRTLGPTQGIL